MAPHQHGVGGGTQLPWNSGKQIIAAVTREHCLLVTLAPSAERADQNKGNTSRWGFLFHPAALPTLSQPYIRDCRKSSSTPLTKFPLRVWGK
jgi:hypothetical protein